MAFVLGRKKVKDTQDFEPFAYGISYPIQNGPTGFFEQNFSSFDQARSNLLNLLQTQKGERIMQPDFGTGLHGLLFEQMDDEEFSVAIQNTITENVNYWLPYISIRDIDVVMTDELKDRNQANLKITFTVGDEIELGEITFTVNG